MSRRGPWRSRALALTLAATANAAMVAGAVSASGGRDALAPTRKPADQNIEKRVDRLLGQMTLEEKLEQIQLLADNQVTEADAKKGVGGVFSLTDPAKIDHYQRIAVEQPIGAAVHFLIESC